MSRKEQLEWINDLPRIDNSAKTPLGQRVYDALLTAITQGVIRQGEHLVEQSLADALGASRISIREAVHRLAATGLVEISPGQGAFVVTLSISDIEEIFGYRALLEGEAVLLATERSLPSDLMRLEEIVHEMEGMESNGDLLSAASVDTRFHRSLVECARHGRLLAGWETMEGLITMLAYDASTTYPNIGDLADRHRRILKPMQRGEGQKASDILRAHILEAGRQLRKSLASGS